MIRFFYAAIVIDSGNDDTSGQSGLPTNNTIPETQLLFATAKN
jgi:hypothetical protein